MNTTPGKTTMIDRKQLISVGQALEHYQCKIGAIRSAMWSILKGRPRRDGEGNPIVDERGRLIMHYRPGVLVPRDADGHPLEGKVRPYALDTYYMVSEIEEIRKNARVGKRPTSVAVERKNAREKEGLDAAKRGKLGDRMKEGRKARRAKAAEVVEAVKPKKTKAVLAAETLAAETLAAETLAAEILAAETLAAETLAAETLAAETLAAETLAAETLAAETLAAEKAALAAKAKMLATKSNKLSRDRDAGNTVPRGPKPAFVMSLPFDMATKEVVARAKKAGIKITESHVRKIRSNQRHGMQLTAKPSKPSLATATLKKARKSA